MAIKQPRRTQRVTLAKPPHLKRTAKVQRFLIRETGGTFLKAVSRAHSVLYRITRGMLGSRVAGLPVLLLTTTGRRSGKTRTMPLGYLTDGLNYVVIGSNAGR